jgi:DNA-directed RNA polymerase omega subunit
MARVTVEGCIDKVPNRFELVLLAVQRTREIISGAPLHLDGKHDKNTVLALREIEEGCVSPVALREALVRHTQVGVHLGRVAEPVPAETSVFAESVGDSMRYLEESSEQEEGVSLGFTEDEMSLDEE